MQADERGGKKLKEEEERGWKRTKEDERGWESEQNGHAVVVDILILIVQLIFDILLIHTEYIYVSVCMYIQYVYIPPSNIICILCQQVVFIYTEVSVRNNYIY